MRYFMYFFAILAGAAVLTADISFAQSQSEITRGPQTPEELQAMMQAESEKQSGKEEAYLSDAIIADSEINAVTVYNNRAKVTRVAIVDVPAGAKTVVFTNLPASLIPSSLRVEGSAKAKVKFGAVSSKTIMTRGLASPREQEINERLEKLQDQRREIDIESKAIDVQRQFLERIAGQAELKGNEEFAENNLKPDQWAGVSQTLRSGMADVLRSALMEQRKSRDLDLEIFKTMGELTLSRTGSRSVFAVMVPLESEAATKLTIELSYQVPNATWAPIYDARLETASSGALHLVQYGAVRQQTGEDWAGAALTLSTAQPQRGASLPDQQPLWIDAYIDKRPPVPQAPSADPLFEWRAKTEAKRIKMESEIIPDEREGLPTELMPMAAPPQQARFTPAVINTGGFVSEYKIPGPSNVLSDGTETKLMVGNFDIDSKLQVHIKPQMSKDAFFVVRSRLKGEAPILPGQVNLFRDGAYVGQSALPLLRPDEDYDLYFGIDDQVAVKHKVLKDVRKEEGVISRDQLLERDVVTELQNLHTAPVEIVVKETVPTSRNEKVRVEIDKESTTPGFEADSDNVKGLLSWQFPLAPKEKKDLKLGWTVKWPTDHTLTGL
jgi:uncharacterized protein (TIGR02231 family)